MQRAEPMTWHLEITALTARRYLPGDSYEARSRFVSVAYLQVTGDGRVYLSAALNHDAGEIPPDEWLALRKGLRALGINVVDSERHGKPRSYEIGKKALGETSIDVGNGRPVVQNGRMPMHYLRSIAQQSLPMRVEDQHDIDCIAVLRAAKLVEAEIEDGDTPGEYRFAIVNSITLEGWVVIARDAGNKPIA
ncbi:MAG TPA: hypothetical protein VMS38_08750 [Pseudorhodoferax sp.]|nr:hypothetical protein [Pseudorhodoferax sp.]